MRGFIMYGFGVAPCLYYTGAVKGNGGFEVRRSRREGGSGVEGSDGVDDGFLLVFAKFGAHRKREGCGGGEFGVGEDARFAAEVGEAGLQMQGEGIVDFGADVMVGEVL